MAFTDGVTESRSRSGELFEQERLEALFHPAPESAAALLERIDASLAAHSGNEEPFDDIAILTVRCEGTARERADAR